MSAHQVIQSAQKAGFLDKGTMGIQLGRNTYKLLHPSTNGQSGRRVYIDIALFSKFQGIKLSRIDDAFVQLCKLKASAGNITSFSAKGKSGQHISVLGQVQVTYRIVQQQTESEPGGVYILDIELSNFAKHDAGLYKVTRDRNKKWLIPDEPTLRVKTKLAAINGFCAGAKQAADELMPKMLDKVYSQGEDAAYIYQEKEYSLFYNPPSLYAKGVQYNENSANSQIALHGLRQALMQAKLDKREVRWAVHGDGIHVLYNALKHMPKQDFSNHTFMFLSSTYDISKILPLLRERQMKLHDDVLQIQENDTLALEAQYGNHKRLKHELSQFPGFENKAETLAEKSLASTRKQHDHIMGAAVLGSGVAGTVVAAKALATKAAAFIAISNPITAVVAAGAGAGYVAYKGVRKAQDVVKSAKNLRNMAAHDIPDPSINPHLNPFGDTIDLNNAFSARFGAAGQSFYHVLKHKLSSKNS
jgi:hypothetical protein